jgi:hypothetical protein
MTAAAQRHRPAAKTRPFDVARRPTPRKKKPESGNYSPTSN